MEKVVDINPLKKLATKLLPVDSVLRRVLLSEPDEMNARDYLAELGTWQALPRGDFSA